MKVLLASTRLLNYGSQMCAKTHTALKQLAKLGKLPLLVGGHDGKRSGEVTGLTYQRKGDLGLLWGHIDQDLPSGWGCSLQYEGQIRGSKIAMRVNDMLHAAILPNPRDTLTLRDSLGYSLFTDAADTNETDDPTNTEDSKEPPKEPPKEEDKEEATKATDQVTQDTTFEIDPEILIDSIIGNDVAMKALTDRILASSDLVDAIIAKLAPTPEPEAPKVKVVVKAKLPERQPTKPTAPLPVQQKLIPVA